LLEKGEQCDDGNLKSLDACSATCAFEQSQRANLIEQRFKTTTLCPRNAFGGAFEGAAQTALQTVLDQRVANGSLSLLFAFRGLKDLSGMSAETITLGMAYGAPTPPVPSSYDGKSDLDWWYTPANGQVDSGVLYSNSTGSLANGVLDASPDSLRIPLLSDVPIYVSNVKVRLTLGDSSAPLASTSVAPGHLASEHLRAGLVSFASAGAPAPVTTDSAQLCGGLSTASLAGIAIPARYAAGGASACLEGYAPARTYLDLLVGGCTVQSGELIAPTQPDLSDPGAPAAGDGAPYKLLANVSTHAVTGCRDKKDAPVALNACLNAAAYSTAYRLKTGRVIIK
jgi:cysteine-rich repeat protein